MRSLTSISVSGFLLLLFFLVTEPVLGQYQDRALERARTVKMLADDREAVRKIFHDFNLDESLETRDDFSFGGTEVGVRYSEGGCSEDDEDQIWDVVAGRVVEIRIEGSSKVDMSSLRINFASLMKEQMFANDDDWFIFHSKTDGIAVQINAGGLKSIELFPSIKSKVKTCRNDFAKDFIGEKSWFGKRKLKDRNIINCYTSDVSELALSQLEISAVTTKQIEVSTSVNNPNNEILTYGYTVSGGSIIGTGPKVRWDLTGVRSGTYTITAGVDDGCGYCGQTKSMTIVVK